MVERYRPKPRVGYGQPPEQTRFKKGRSGNPKGLSVKSIEPADILAAELRSRVAVTENGRRVLIDKLTLMFRQAVNKAASGDFRQFGHAMKCFDKIAQILSNSKKNARPRMRPEDFNKLTLDEKIKKLRELIADTKPLEGY